MKGSATGRKIKKPSDSFVGDNCAAQQEGRRSDSSTVTFSSGCSQQQRVNFQIVDEEKVRCFCATSAKNTSRRQAWRSTHDLILRTTRVECFFYFSLNANSSTEKRTSRMGGNSDKIHTDTDGVCG